MKAQVFYYDEYLGEGQLERAECLHHFCRQCGTIWARIICDAPLHTVLTGYCPEHDIPGLHFPAVLSLPLRFQTVRLPRAALVRDFLHLMSTREQVMDDNPPHKLCAS